MRKTVLEALTDSESIFSNGTDVLVAGKYLRLFRADGTFVTKFAPIRHPRRVAFLPNRTALVEGAADEGYHYLSLTDGVILWSCQQKGHGHIDGPHCFAVSPDGTRVYTLYYPRYGVMAAEQICPLAQTYKKIRSEICLRSTDAIFCGSDGVLCALQQHTVQKCDNRGIPVEPGYHQHGILAIPFDGQKPYWKQQWQTTELHRAQACDGRYILYEDFSILDLKTDAMSRLISQEEYDTLPHRGFIWQYDPVRFLLTIRYVGARMNLVIDCIARKVLAKYIPDEQYGFPGCLIGEEFWLGSEKGVLRLPFPLVQSDVPSQKSFKHY